MLYFGFRPGIQGIERNSDSYSDNQASLYEKEIVALLSVKFGVEEKTIQELLDEYNAAHERNQELKKGTKPNTDYKNTIIKISEEYGLPKETVADIILIYLDLIDNDVPVEELPAKTDEWDVWEKWDN